MGWIWIGFCLMRDACRHRHSPGKQDYKKTQIVTRKTLAFVRLASGLILPRERRSTRKHEDMLNFRKARRFSAIYCRPKQDDPLAFERDRGIGQTIGGGAVKAWRTKPRPTPSTRPVLRPDPDPEELT